jgi:hypothetical protein
MPQIKLICWRLRDASEDMRKSPAFLSISSCSDTGSSHLVLWNAAAPLIIAASHFQLSADKTTVQILKNGVYQMSVQLAKLFESFSPEMVLLLSDGNDEGKFVEVARCH